MSVLLSSATFWMTVLTILSFFVAYCYLGSFYSSFNAFAGNLAVSDVLIKSIPGIGIIVLLSFFVLDPKLPWHAFVAQSLSDESLSRTLLQVTTFSAALAMLMGRLRARQALASRKRVTIYSGKDKWSNVIIVGFSKNFVIFYDSTMGCTRCSSE